ncbi:hypothetical protein GSMA_03516 [Serratia marcescens subsp. marcescens ATCC 13880]|nr:hypothetical protein GSMA_03516 [Serratia marcescens subsp. marcescens ATCC 13880]
MRPCGRAAPHCHIRVKTTYKKRDDTLKYHRCAAPGRRFFSILTKFVDFINRSCAGFDHDIIKTHELSAVADAGRPLCACGAPRRSLIRFRIDGFRHRRSGVERAGANAGDPRTAGHHCRQRRRQPQGIGS